MENIRIDNDGIHISNDETRRVVADPAADQISPRGFYVYAHVDRNGTIFYVGKGTGRRAWSDDRHYLWHRYLATRTSGQYKVLILADGLSADDAERLESRWLSQEVKTLVNWINLARKSDYAEIARCRDLRDANRTLIKSARDLEKTAPEEAASKYAEALAELDKYAFINSELGLVGELIDEDCAEHGYGGDLTILDRYSIVLIKLGRADEARLALERYAIKFRRDNCRSAIESIRSRIDKAVRKR